MSVICFSELINFSTKLNDDFETKKKRAFAEEVKEKQFKNNKRSENINNDNEENDNEAEENDLLRKRNKKDH